MNDVKPISPNMIALHDKDILQLISQVKWGWRSNFGYNATYLVIGGNYWLQLQQRMRRVSLYSGVSDLTGTLTQIQGLQVVVVKRDILECGE